MAFCNGMRRLDDDVPGAEAVARAVEFFAARRRGFSIWSRTLPLSTMGEPIDRRLGYEELYRSRLHLALPRDSAAAFIRTLTTVEGVHVRLKSRGSVPQRITRQRDEQVGVPQQGRRDLDDDAARCT